MNSTSLLWCGRKWRGGRSCRGSVLLTAMLFAMVFVVVSASILGLSMFSYRSAMRNEAQAQARAVAESELESFYFKLRTQMGDSVPCRNVPGILAAQGIVENAMIPHEDHLFDAFLEAHRAAGWRVNRSMWWDTNYSVQGWIPAGQLSTWGTFTYVDAKIEVRPPLNTPFADNVVVRVGRQFSNYSFSIFQHAVFYQGDLELYPGGNVIIDGDVVANGSIYMGSTGPTITLTGKVTYLSGHYFNTAADGAIHLGMPGSPAELAGLNTPPIFDPNIHDGVIPDQATAMDAQLVQMDRPENLLGGTDAALLLTNRPDLFPTENDVYRAALVPPPNAPDVTGVCDEYPSWTSGLADDPSIAAQRIYNKAGMRIVVDSSVSPAVVTVSMPIDPSDLTAGYTTTGTTPFAAAVTGTANMWDAREAADVKVTTIDVATLKTALETTLDAGGQPVSRTFNGVLYVYLKNGNATHPSAVKLINGAALPLVGPLHKETTGFSVATNGGLYVQGDYNTSLLPNGTILPDDTVLADGVVITATVHNPPNPSMLMADAITVLSKGWSDTNAAAHLDTHTRDAITTGDAITNKQTIMSGLLVGNVSATTSTNSGGVQNLVRYLENWSGQNVDYYGSIGRLFNSKMFTHPFVGTWNGGAYEPTRDVYGLPDNRNFAFNTWMTRLPPPSSPSNFNTSRGRFYYW